MLMTIYAMRISNCSAVVCSSDLPDRLPLEPHRGSDLGRLWRNRGRCGIYAPRAYHHSVQPAFREQRDRRHAGAGDIEHSAALSFRISDGGCRYFLSLLPSQIPIHLSSPAPLHFPCFISLFFSSFSFFPPLLLLFFFLSSLFSSPLFPLPFFFF